VVKQARLEGWSCQDQSDLTELTDTEHIAGSMPASDAEREAAREIFYEQLRERARRLAAHHEPNGRENP
jgi:hypothetical protein